MLEKRRRRPKLHKDALSFIVSYFSLDELTSVARLRRKAVEETRRESASALPPYFLFISLMFATCWLLFPVPFFTRCLLVFFFLPIVSLGHRHHPSLPTSFFFLFLFFPSFLCLNLSDIWSLSFVTSFPSSLYYLHPLILVLPYFLPSFLLFNTHFICFFSFSFSISSLLPVFLFLFLFFSFDFFSVIQSLSIRSFVIFLVISCSCFVSSHSVQFPVSLSLSYFTAYLSFLLTSFLTSSFPHVAIFLSSSSFLQFSFSLPFPSFNNPSLTSFLSNHVLILSSLPWLPCFLFPSLLPFSFFSPSLYTCFLPSFLLIILSSLSQLSPPFLPFSLPPSFLSS